MLKFNNSEGTLTEVLLDVHNSQLIEVTNHQIDSCDIIYFNLNTKQLERAKAETINRPEGSFFIVHIDESKKADWSSTKYTNIKDYYLQNFNTNVEKLTASMFLICESDYTDYDYKVACMQKSQYYLQEVANSMASLFEYEGNQEDTH